MRSPRWLTCPQLRVLNAAAQEALVGAACNRAVEVRQLEVHHPLELAIGAGGAGHIILVALQSQQGSGAATG